MLLDQLLASLTWAARGMRTGSAASLLVAVGGGACTADGATTLAGDAAPPLPPAVPSAAVAEGVTARLALSPTDTTLQLGDTLRVAAVARDSGGAPVEPHAAIWSVSGDSAITLADAGGLVRATGPGTGHVVVSVDGVADSTRIHVAADAAEPRTAVARPAPPRLLDLDRVRFFDPARGRTIRVAAGGNLQAALDDARPGDQILLAPGARFRGKFLLPRKPARNGRWITLRTDLGADSLPAGTRMTPETATRLRLATLVGTGAMPEPTVATEAETAGWRLVEVEVTVDSALARFGTLVRFGENEQRSREGLPGDLVLDRAWVHGHANVDLLRCVLLNGTSSAVMNSTVDDCHAKGFDSYAVGGVSGPGPFKIVNNYLAGAGMGIFFGGADPRIPNLSPSDFEIRQNHVTRSLAWKGRWTVKNLLEFKHARRALIEGNVFENHWVDGQAGPAIVLKSTNQSGLAPWSQTSDVTFRFNIVRNAPAGLSLAAKPEPNPAEFAARIAIEDNLFYNIGEFQGTRNGRMLILLGPLTDVTIARNTMLHGAVGTHAMLLDTSRPSRNLEVVGNVFTRGTYGVWATGAGEGTLSLERAWPGTWTFRDNVVVTPTAPRAGYPDASRIVSLAAQATRVDAATSWSDLGRTVQEITGAAAAGVDLSSLATRLRAVGAELQLPKADRAQRTP